MLKVYHMSNSRSLRILWALEEAGLAYEMIKVERDELKKADYLEKNPIGKVPVFFDGDKMISESVAAIQYIDQVYNQGALSRKAGNEDFHDFLQFMEIGEAGMGSYGGILVGHTILLPEKHRNPQVAAWAKGEIDNLLEYLEGKVPEDSYLLGEFSLADISVVYLLFLLKITRNADGFGEKTNAYFKRATAREAWQKVSKL